MRSVGDKDLFTPTGLWIREYLRKSDNGLCVTNLDFIIEDFRHRRLMLLEEKQSNGKLHHGQKMSFKLLDNALRDWSPTFNPPYEYWGFYVLTMPAGCTMPGPGMTLNGKTITGEQLKAHLDFEKRFCEPTFPTDENYSPGAHVAVPLGTYSKR